VKQTARHDQMVEVDPTPSRARGVVLVGVTAGATWFDCRLTRVPCIGESISREGSTYRVTAVEHQLIVDDLGHAIFGWHALIDAELIPPQDCLPSVRLPRLRIKRRGRGRRLRPRGPEWSP
jgi:hypothetical protein